MQLRIFTEPQMGATYDDLLAVARRTEETGFDAFFRSDHYLTMGGDGLPGPTDAWVTLAGLARETSRIRLGTLMTAATFRLPGPLAISVAQVDQMSGGRVELGIGAGWFEAEHAAYGIPFPELGERFDRYEEQVAIVSGLWNTPPGETFDFPGEHYRVSGVARAAQAGAEGRDPADRRRLGEEAHPTARRPVRERVQRPLRLGRRQRPAVRRRARRLRGGRPRPGVPGLQLGAGPVRRHGRGGDRPAGGRDRPGRRRAAAHGVAGTPAEAVDVLGRYAEAGAQRVYLQVLDLADLDHLDLVAAEVAPQLA